jgi:hypothetical protein
LKALAGKAKDKRKEHGMKRRKIPCIFLFTVFVSAICSCASSGYIDKRPLVDQSLFQLEKNNSNASIQIQMQGMPLNLGTALKTGGPRPDINIVTLDGKSFRLLSYQRATQITAIDKAGKTISESASYAKLKQSALKKYDTRGLDGRFEFLTFLDFLPDQDLEFAHTGELPIEAGRAATVAVESHFFVFADSEGVLVPIQILSRWEEASQNPN